MEQDYTKYFPYTNNALLSGKVNIDMIFEAIKKAVEDALREKKKVVHTISDKEIKDLAILEMPYFNHNDTDNRVDTYRNGYVKGYKTALQSQGQSVEDALRGKDLISVFTDEQLSFIQYMSGLSKAKVQDSYYEWLNKFHPAPNHELDLNLVKAFGFIADKQPPQLQPKTESIVDAQNKWVSAVEFVEWVLQNENLRYMDKDSWLLGFGEYQLHLTSKELYKLYQDEKNNNPVL